MAKKRALLVGINEYPVKPLRGCLNDILDMANLLASDYGFAKEDVRLVGDARATRTEIFKRLEWLTSGLEAGDTAFFMFSGHGVQVASRSGSGEVDRMDEAICPYDFSFSSNNAIRDDDLETVFRRVPAGVSLTIVSDSCHSEGLTTELRALESDEDIVVDRSPERDAYFVEKFYPLPIDLAWRVEAAKEKGIDAVPFGEKAADNGNLVMLSGCLRNQLSADASFGGRPNGAFTRYLIHVLQRHRDKPMSEVIKIVRDLLNRDRFVQQPQVEGGDALIAAPFLGGASGGGGVVKGKNARAAKAGDGDFARFKAELRKLIDRY